MGELDTAAVAALYADRSRVAMIDLLLDGRPHTVAGLARAAGIRPSTAVEHVQRLEQGGVVVSRREGRERLVRLSGPSAAAVYEALAELAQESDVASLRAWTRREELRAARTCYDHLAGRLGVAVADAAVTAGALAEDFSLDPAAGAFFGRLGVELDALPRGRRPLLRVCTDWTERREHLAGVLGAAVCAAFLEAGWVARRPSSRALTITPLGETRLLSLGVAVPSN
jgi:DNA-binding transcriptional ArsR family regulator